MFELALLTFGPMRSLIAEYPDKSLADLVTHAFTQVDAASSDDYTARMKSNAKHPQSGCRKIIEIAAYAVKNGVSFSEAVTAKGGDPAKWDPTYLAQATAAMTEPLV